MSTVAAGRAQDAGRAARPLGRSVLRNVFAGVAALAVVLAASTAVMWTATPSVGDLLQRAREVQAAHGEVPRLDPPASRIVAALVATEDSRFFTHHGVDPYGAVRGSLGVLDGNALAGGSSLDQQLAKVLYLPRTDLIGKAEQIVVGVKIDAGWSKQDVLRAYLSSVYFGHGFWGVDAASGGYFGLRPQQLSTGQAALLAGIVQAPSAYDPVEHLDLALQRRAHVLDRMVATGALTPAAAAAAAHAPLALRP
ncbi:biosynthetic peptidoglycan transglycosylase [Pseudonocardia alni]|uniref:biosynthetic peptidoglycan transglycosylase n=1 Tax=Pseudonocardia alni TaxID=33907 RepID=UPI0033FA7D18